MGLPSQISSDALIKQAHELILKNEIEKAEQHLNILLNSAIHNPQDKFMITWLLSHCFLKTGRYGLAMILLKKLRKEKPDFIECLNNIGFIYKEEEIRDKAYAAFREVLELMEKPELAVNDSDKSYYYTNMGAVYIANGTPQKAIEYFKKAMPLDDKNQQAKWNYGLANLETGNYGEGFDFFEFGDRTERVKNRKYTNDPTPLWDGTKDQNVVVYGEQGIGDELMFATMIPDLIKDCKLVIFDAHPRLADMFRRSFPNIPVYGTRKTDPLWYKFHKVDARIQIGSLGKFYRREEKDFPRKPYLLADLQLIEKYAVKLEAMGPRPKIGISWRGGVKSTNKNVRHIPLWLLKDILDLPCDFISLQYNKEAEQEVEEFCKGMSVRIHHWQDVLNDYDETAGLVSNLDLIISVPQSVVHLAGALGKTTWQLCPKKALWQMGVYGQDMPWYNCVKNIWQESDEKWEPVVKTVKDNLCSLLAQSTLN